MNIDLEKFPPKFLDLIWENEPISLGELAELCKKTLNWEKLVVTENLDNLVKEGVMKNKYGIITSMLSRDEFYDRLPNEESPIQRRQGIKLQHSNTPKQLSIDDKKPMDLVGKLKDINESVAKTDEEAMNNVTVMGKDLKIANDQFNKMLDQMKESGLYDYFVKEMESRKQAASKKVTEINKNFLPIMDSIIESVSKICTENHMKSNAEDRNWKLEVDLNDIVTQKEEAEEYLKSIITYAKNILFAYKKLKDQYGSDFTYLDMENNEDLSYLKDEITDAEEQLFARTDRIIMGLTKHQFNVTVDQMKERGLYDAFVQDIERRIYELAQREKEINKDYFNELNSIESRKYIYTKTCETLDSERAMEGQELDAVDLTMQKELLDRDLEYVYRNVVEILNTYSEKKSQNGPDFDETKDNELTDQLRKFDSTEKEVYERFRLLFASEESEDENIEDQQIDDHKRDGKIRMSEWRKKTNVSHEKTEESRFPVERPDQQQKGIPKNKGSEDKGSEDKGLNPDLT